QRVDKPALHHLFLLDQMTSLRPSHYNITHYKTQCRTTPVSRSLKAPEKANLFSVFFTKHKFNKCDILLREQRILKLFITFTCRREFAYASSFESAFAGGCDHHYAVGDRSRDGTGRAGHGKQPDHVGIRAFVG